jgi:hypothetical protein
MKNEKMRDSLILYEVQVPMTRVFGKIFRDPEIYILIVSYRVIQDSGTNNRPWHRAVTISEFVDECLVEPKLRTILCPNLRKLVLTLKEC